MRASTTSWPSHTGTFASGDPQAHLGLPQNAELSLSRSGWERTTEQLTDLLTQRYTYLLKADLTTRYANRVDRIEDAHAHWWADVVTLLGPTVIILKGLEHWQGIHAHVHDVLAFNELPAGKTLADVIAALTGAWNRRARTSWHRAAVIEEPRVVRACVRYALKSYRVGRRGIAR